MARSPKDDLKYLEAKLKQNPDSILFARLAEAYLEINRIDDAIKLCEIGLRKHPYYVTGHYIMSKCYFKKKQFDNAEKELKRVLLFDPQYIAAHRDYADLMVQIGWHSSCEASYEKIFMIDPLNKKARKKLDELRQKSKFAEESESDLDVELGEFEEEALFTNEAAEIAPLKKLPPDNVTKIIEEQPVEKSEPAISENNGEEEKFSYILDDIFGDESVASEEDVQQIESDIENTEFSSLEDEEELDTDVASSLESEREEDETESEVPENSLSKEDEEDIRLSANIEQILRDDNDEMMSTIADKQPENPFETELQHFSLDDIETPADEEDDIGYLPDEEESFEHAINQTLDDEPEPLQSEEPDVDEKQVYEERQPAKSKAKEKIVTPTLGEIYAAQHQYAKAIGVYEILKKNNPNNPIYQQKIDYLKRRLEESQD